MRCSRLSTGWRTAIDAGSNTMVNRNGRIFTIVASLSDKGYASRNWVMAAIFAYLSLLQLLLRH